MTTLQEIFKEHEETRKDSNALNIFRALMDAGDLGMSNIELAKITHRFGSSIFTLRDDGFEIDIENRGNGLIQYYLRNYIPKQKEETKKGIDKLSDGVESFGGLVSMWEIMTVLEENNLQVIRKPSSKIRRTI